MAAQSISKLLSLGDPNQKFTLNDLELARIERSHRHLMRILEEGSQRVYGIHTGYGANVLSERDPLKWRETQIDLLNYLQVGVGPALPASVVRRALRLQALKVAQGHSGIHPETVQALAHLSNAETLPSVPCSGSLGASGDLIPMAHAIAPLFEQQAPRGPRDVIGLVNTNAMMVSYAIELFHQVEELFEEAHTITAEVMQAVAANRESVLPGVAKLRRNDEGYDWSATRIRDSLLPQEIRLTNERTSWLQPRYSIRCAPMVLGNAFDLLQFAERKILQDAESVADNPVLIDGDDGIQVAHAGLFYAASTATAADFMNDVLGKVGEMLDRQILIEMDPKLSEGLPENLAHARDTHCKGLHQLVSALVQQLRAASTPSRNLSFSSEGNNQDIVPCAMTALNQLSSSVQTARDIARASAFISLRALHLRMGRDLPEELMIKRWSQFDFQVADQLRRSLRESNQKPAAKAA